MNRHMKKDINSHLETVTETVTVTDTANLKLVNKTATANSLASTWENLNK